MDVACPTDAVNLYMISSPPASVAGHYINRLFCAETKTTSKTLICDRKPTDKSPVVPICRARLQ